MLFYFQIWRPRLIRDLIREFVLYGIFCVFSKSRKTFYLSFLVDYYFIGIIISFSPIYGFLNKNYKSAILVT